MAAPDATANVLPASAPGVRGGHTHELLLLGLVIAEIAYFAYAGSNFFTAGNAAEVARASVEIGLLALALTAVILTGGIDLSVGSLLGLAAVLMGAAHRDLGLPMAVAAVVALLVGIGGGALNARARRATRACRLSSSPSERTPSSVE